MAFTFAAFCYMLTLVLCASLIFFIIWHYCFMAVCAQSEGFFLSPVKLPEDKRPMGIFTRGQINFTIDALKQKVEHLKQSLAKELPDESLERVVVFVEHAQIAQHITRIIAFDELRTDFKNPIEQGNPSRARERVKNVERICCLLRKLVVPEYCIHGLFCLMFMCAAEWVTLGLNIPLLFYHLWRYFHRPADGSEVMFDPVSIMNVDILNYCQKEAWCKLAFYLLSFFYYLYRVGATVRYVSA
ncbi:hypothetical protein XELAEV_18022338mg [Xenopus laevis]|uniref:Protein cornichon homolog 2 n=2 Tax=Pipidae TaxID=8352 RepID=A0A974HN40_XENLA|nr:hypothetical protein XELAEV_18022338mg [Xenopus laevis]